MLPGQMVLLMDNYAIQAGQAKKRFLTYDQEKLITRFRLEYDAQYLYFTMLGEPYRLNRKSGDLERKQGVWLDGNSFEEVMTALDILCDARDDRSLAGRWKPMQDFGHQFHSKLLEQGRDPLAQRFQSAPEQMLTRCAALGGEPMPGGDIAMSFPLMDDLRIGVRFWFEDEDFPPSVWWYWDENVDRYIRYETMYYAVNLLRGRLLEP